MSWVLKVKQWVGPLWWYTAILFVVQRLADLVNAFVGLYLVPLYVPQSELGALLPLTQVGGVLAMPLAILALTFAKQVNTYASRGEYGKLKSLLRDVFLIAVVLFVATMLYARFFMPLVFERMRVSDGRLGLLVVASGVLGALGTIFLSASQALKKFRLLATIGVLSTPLRLVTLLICLPIRALSGYFVGQIVPVIFSIAASIFGLRTFFLGSVKAEPYWRQDGLGLLKYAVPVTLGILFGTLQSLVESFVIRHRLPEMDSAGYYMISRFAEVGSHVGSTLVFVLFPLASEQHERRNRSQKLILQGMGLSLLSGLLLALGFRIMGGYLFGLVPSWHQYAGYMPHLVILTVICAIRSAMSCFIANEMACRRFLFLIYVGIISASEAVFLYGVTGYSFFEPWLPASWISWMAGLKAARLEYLLGVMFWWSVVPLALMGTQLVWQRRQRTREQALND